MRDERSPGRIMLHSGIDLHKRGIARPLPPRRGPGGVDPAALALDSGFADQSHFTRVFGAVPRRWRELHGK